VPLLVQTQGIRAGEVDLPVQHLDIPPTLMAGENITIPNHYEGEALQTLDRNLEEPIFFALSADEVAVRSGEWKYVERHGERALYRVPHMELEEIPAEGNREKRKEMSSLLDRFRNKTVLGDQPASLEMNDLSPEVEANLEDLGYR
jgi:arylsulfatase A-like enzyme